jgi:hypothetical protein
MKELGIILQEITPSFFDSSSRKTPKNAVQFAIKAFLKAPELYGKIKSEGEGNALIGLIGAYAKEHYSSK